MDSVESLLATFLGSSLHRISSEETFVAYSLEAAGQITATPEAALLKSVIAALPDGDWALSVALEGQDSPHSLVSNNLALIDIFLSDVEFGKDLAPNAKLKLIFSKCLRQSEISVFDPDALFSWINGLPLPVALNKFSEIADGGEYVTFCGQGFLFPVATGFFRFSQRGLSDSVEKGAGNRNELLSARRELTVSDWNNLNLLPDDFRWRGEQKIAALERRFAAIENFLGVVSLVDATIATAAGFSLKVKGNIAREETVEWGDVPVSPEITIRHLFEWAYRTSGAGPLSDKLGLARNFISLYWEFGIFSLDIRVVAAVRSGFTLYLKKNLKDFIELRAKVASFIVEIDGKASKAVETAIGNFEKNFYGLTTFVTSVVLIKVIQDKTFQGAFTPALTKVALALIVISALHAVFARHSALREMDRAYTLYSDLRQLYSAFFTSSDFDSIFKSDGKSPIKKTEDYVRSRLRGLMWIWCITLIVALVLLYTLTTPVHPK